MPTDDQLKKTVILGIAAIAAMGCLVLVLQRFQYSRFWSEVDDFRETSRFGEFLEWERKQRGLHSTDDDPGDD
jgi:DNA-binding transcriptional regulator of glucitol operon